MQRRIFARLLTTVVAGLLLSSACGREELRDGGSATDACAGKACGATCAVCAENDPNCGILGYCNAEGTCAVPFPVCPPPTECNADADCPQIESCSTCPDGSALCPETRCIDGKCTISFPQCPVECASADDCPELGMPCQQCPDGSIVCPGFDCIDGRCIAKYAGCAYEPCADKVCGAACTVCNPLDPDCVETAVLKLCDERGVCTVEPVDCGHGDICNLPMDPGPCDAAMPRYWFNATTGKCEPFVYGGCEGNANNFETAEACTDACADPNISPCQAITCEAGASCVYLGVTPVCANDCATGDVCPSGLDCVCAGSCAGCEDCHKVCVASR